MGNHFEAPVLLIKAAWGGKSTGRVFRPPSSGPQSKGRRLYTSDAAEDTPCVVLGGSCTLLKKQTILPV